MLSGGCWQCCDSVSRLLCVLTSALLMRKGLSFFCGHRPTDSSALPDCAFWTSLDVWSLITFGPGMFSRSPVFYDLVLGRSSALLMLQLFVQRAPEKAQLIGKCWQQCWQQCWAGLSTSASFRRGAKNAPALLICTTYCPICFLE